MTDHDLDATNRLISSSESRKDIKTTLMDLNTGKELGTSKNLNVISEAKEIVEEEEVKINHYGLDFLIAELQRIEKSKWSWATAPVTVATTFLTLS